METKFCRKLNPAVAAGVAVERSCAGQPGQASAWTPCFLPF